MSITASGVLAFASAVSSTLTYAYIAWYLDALTSRQFSLRTLWSVSGSILLSLPPLLSSLPLSAKRRPDEPTPFVRTNHPMLLAERQEFSIRSGYPRGLVGSARPCMSPHLNVQVPIFKAVLVLRTPALQVCAVDDTRCLLLL